MSSKEVYRYDDIKDKIIKAVNLIADPVKQTLSPKGGNVIFQDNNGTPIVTNDGVTIAKNISSDDEVINTIVDIIKHASLRTNTEAGDGTTTTIVLTQALVHEGFKLLDNGMNPIELKKALEKVADKLVERIQQKKVKIKDDKDMFKIATISANNDEAIASNVVDVVKFSGEDGMVFIEPNNKQETEIIKEPGFRIESGMFSPELRTHPAQFSSTYKNVPVLITDTRIYYREQAETILKTAIKSGHKAVVVVARDFIGDAPATFIANHAANTIKVLLVKDTQATENNSESLDDLAMYLGGKVMKEKTGSIVDKLTEKDFVIANQVFADSQKTIFTPKISKNSNVDKLVETLRKELEKDKENKVIKKRIASLTSGTTTVKVGGSTEMEINEKIYRYEDAINATRAAVRDGYLIGGGVTLLRSYADEDHPEEMRGLVRKFTESSLRQIAENCGKHKDFVVEMVKANKSNSFGYNALKDTYEDLLKAGVVDPYKVTEMAIRNSISVANVILSSKFLIVNKIEKNDK